MPSMEARCWEAWRRDPGSPVEGGRAGCAAEAGALCWTVRGPDQIVLDGEPGKNRATISFHLDEIQKIY